MVAAISLAGMEKLMAIEHERSARFIRTPEAAVYTGLAKSTLEKLRVTGNGPRYACLGRVVVYETVDLDDWIAANKRRSTADTGGSVS